jgi:two-component system, cell cycle response regulator DivK
VLLGWQKKGPQVMLLQPFMLKFTLPEVVSPMESEPTILYVEDNPDNRMLLRRILMAEGFNMLEAANAHAALEMLETVRPDLILMDINMPDIDGYTLTTQLKARPDLASVPIVALTANVMRGDRERTLEAGCDGYIQKPIDIDTIGEQVLSFLKR